MTAAGLFPPGSLAALAALRVREARQNGALQSIATELSCIDDGGIRFLVRVLASLKQKEREAQARADGTGRGQAGANPFLPHDPRLFVADLTPTHFCLLNKFNVVDSHLLLVTRAFEDQERLLTPANLDAMAAALGEIDGLGFFSRTSTCSSSRCRSPARAGTQPCRSNRCWRRFSPEPDRGRRRSFRGFRFAMLFSASTAGQTPPTSTGGTGGSLPPPALPRPMRRCGPTPGRPWPTTCF